MRNGIFHPVAGNKPQRALDGSVREFVGDGTALLAVPGLRRVESVQVGPMPLPLTRDYKFPLNADFSQKIHTTLPHVQIERAEDGMTVLLRSVHSNDGIWQAGEKVYVGGEWEDEAAKRKQEAKA